MNNNKITELGINEYSDGIHKMPTLSDQSNTRQDSYNYNYENKR